MFISKFSQLGARVVKHLTRGNFLMLIVVQTVYWKLKVIWFLYLLIHIFHVNHVTEPSVSVLRSPYLYAVRHRNLQSLVSVVFWWYIFCQFFIWHSQYSSDVLFKEKIKSWATFFLLYGAEVKLFAWYLNHILWCLIWKNNCFCIES